MLNTSNEERKRRLFYIFVTVFTASLLISLLWFYFSRGFESILACLGSIAALAETIVVRQRRWTTAIIIFVITIFMGAAITLVTDLGVWTNAESATITIRATDDSGEAILRAKALLFYTGPPVSQFTDSNGIAIFRADPNQVDAQLIVEKDDFQIYEQTISLSEDQDISILLERKDQNNRHAIIRAIDDDTNSPIEGAKIVLIVSGDIYEDITDSNGLSRFTIQFTEQMIDAELQVITDEYETSNKSITLRPERVQDVKLDPIAKEVVQIENADAVERSKITFPEANSNSPVNGAEQSFVSQAVASQAVSPITEQEPNNSIEEAQPLNEIGMLTPIQSEITPASNESEIGDQDWYRFTATAGETYVVELFDVANTVSLVTEQYNCGSGTRNYSGLRLAISDPFLNEVSRKCTPSGTGNVHTVEKFTAGVSGDYYIQVSSHAPIVAGGYSLRVLPKYSQSGATWDAETFEPNNQIATAYPISVGWEQAISSAIEPRNDTFSTNESDRDAYRFDAVAGQTYVVELFEVSNTLTLKSHRYDCGVGTRDYDGLRLAVFDPFENEVDRQCRPTGAANVHSAIQFTAGNDGVFHILVYPHESTVAGSYRIRVLPKYDEPYAGWDTTIYEPNNKAPNAFQIEHGASNALQGAIEARNDRYGTNQADRDWYYFTGEAGKVYRIELFDVDNRLELATARYNCGEGAKDHTGLWLGAFDPSVNEIVRQCSPNGADDVYSYVEFTASRDGIYYMLTYPHEGFLAGDYRIRVIER